MVREDLRARYARRAEEREVTLGLRPLPPSPRRHISPPRLRSGRAVPAAGACSSMPTLSVVLARTGQLL